MTAKQKSIAAQVIRLSKENARMRVTLTEILFRCERQLTLREYATPAPGDEKTIADIRDAAKKALESPDGTMTIKKGKS